MEASNLIINTGKLIEFQKYFESSCLFLIGVSNSGKSTLSNEIIKQRLNFKIIPTVTTRSKRLNDTEDEIRFISESEFNESNHANEFFYTNHKNSVWYGYSIIDLQCIISENKNCIFCFQGAGAFEIKKAIKNIPSIFLFSDLDTILKRNLVLNKTIVSEQISLELTVNRESFNYYSSFETNNFIVDNNKYYPPISPIVVEETLKIIDKIYKL